MKKNMGVFDRTIRTVFAIIAGLSVYLGFVGAVSSFVLLAVAGVFVLTSLVGFCPLYSVLGVSTCLKE